MVRNEKSTIKKGDENMGDMNVLILIESEGENKCSLRGAKQTLLYYIRKQTIDF